MILRLRLPLKSYFVNSSPLPIYQQTSVQLIMRPGERCLRDSLTPFSLKILLVIVPNLLVVDSSDTSRLPASSHVSILRNGYPGNLIVTNSKKKKKNENLVMLLI
jgi:hypothetical protein